MSGNGTLIEEVVVFFSINRGRNEVRHEMI